MKNYLFDKESEKYIREFAHEMSNSWINDRVMDDLRNTPIGEIMRDLGQNDGCEIEDSMAKCVGERELPVNTYPFGEPTNEIYPQWIGVYREYTKITGLNKMIKKMVSYAQRENTVSNKSKTIVVFTDVWNATFEERIVKAMLPFYKQGICLVKIFLFNDYGITVIPFFMTYLWKSLKKIRLKDKYEIMEERNAIIRDL